MNLDDIYSEIILEHSRSKKNRKTIKNPTVTLKGVNPSCGDDISLELIIDDGKIIDGSFSGEGCAISQASTSIMLDLIRGKSLKDIKELLEIYIDMIVNKEEDSEKLDKLEDAIAFQNISNMPARVKCALLSWRTLEEEIK